MSGRGLVPGQELQAHAVQPGFRLVDVFITKHDTVSELPISFGEGLQCVTHGLLAQTGHSGRFVAQGGDIALQAFFKMRMRLHRAHC